MVDPNVLEFVGYDPEEWTGFAFGIGLERIAMLRRPARDRAAVAERPATPAAVLR